MKLFTLLATLSLLTSCTNYLVVQNHKLWKDGAYRTQIMWVGQKSRNGKQMFDSYTQLVFDKLPAHVSVGINSETTEKWLAELRLEGAKPIASIASTVDGSDSERHVSTLVSIQDKRDLLKVINSRANRQIVMEWMNKRDPRVIVAVATAEAAEKIQSRSFDVEARANLTAMGAPGDMAIKLGNGRNNSMKFGKNTVYAYTMAIPAWKRENGQIVVGDLVEDIPGRMNPKPDRGCYLDISDVP